MHEVPQVASQLEKHAVLQSADTGIPTDELVQSWQRSLDAIGTPDNLRDVPHIPEDLIDEHLLELFAPAMNRFSADLSGTGLALLLADSRGAILERWTQDRAATSHLDRVGTVRGAVLAENAVGTNGIGTAITLGKLVQIRGEEHFADFYQSAVCTSAPVLHPVTNNLLAVVTVSCDVAPRTELLKPLVRSMSTQLEMQLASVEHPASLEMFNLFLKLSRDGANPVLAIGPQGSVIQSTAAHRLRSSDIEAIRHLTLEGRPTGRYTVELSEGPATVGMRAVGYGHYVVIVRGTSAAQTAAGSIARTFRVAGQSKDWRAAVRDVERNQRMRRVAIIGGESGTGKTTAALGSPFRMNNASTPDHFLEAANRYIIGQEAWLASVAETLDTHETLVVRGIDTLDTATQDALRSILEKHEGTATVTMTVTTASREELASYGLRFGAEIIWLRPLRDRTEDIASLWAALVDGIAPESGLSLSVEAEEQMRRYTWPGNVNEMRRLVLHLLSAGKRGEVGVLDLPPHMQNAKNLSMIERAELDAIRRALETANGSRAKAADILGVSRATVYRKMKTYKLDAS